MKQLSKVEVVASMNALDAKAILETKGLHISWTGVDSLWIAATTRDTGSGIKLSNDACSLTRNSDRWMAIFPAQGLATYEVPGTLMELADLIVEVYANYRQAGGYLKDAVKRVLSDADQYIVGGSPAHV